MKTIDIGAMFVVYNFVIGVLVMLSSEKVAAFAGNFTQSYREKMVRLTRVATFAFGACVAVLSGFIYVAFHLLKIDV